MQKNTTAANSSSGVSSTNDDSDGGGGGTAAAATAARVAAEKLTLTFPRVAKFPETITKPNFYNTGGLKDGRMYEEEVPLAKVRDLLNYWIYVHDTYPDDDVYIFDVFCVCT